MSHPSRVRGLKLPGKLNSFHFCSSHPSRVRGLKHAPSAVRLAVNLSHPSRVRGLKLIRRKTAVICGIVAPFTGAWIETLGGAYSGGCGRSHPSRVRGLKLVDKLEQFDTDESHPSRVRGLKLHRQNRGM